MNKEVVNFGGKKYTLKKKLGVGNYGEAWLATSPSGKEFVVKKIMVSRHPASAATTWGDKGQYLTTNIDDFIAEKNLSKEITKYNCPSLIKYIGASRGSGNIRYIVMEYFNGYTLFDLERCSNETGFLINPDQILKIAKHLFQGLARMHKHGIVHNDIHNGNIMFNKTEMKIIDYGRLCTLTPPYPNTKYSCYGNNITTGSYLDEEKDYKHDYDYTYKNQTYPFYRDSGMMVTMLRFLSHRNIGSLPADRSKWPEVIKLFDRLDNPPPKYTSQEVLDELNKIPGKNVNIY